MITFIRHCECYLVNNDQSMNYMRVNPPLTIEGIQRAQKITGFYDHVIISPLSRCIETYIYSDIKSKSREVNELFREIIVCPGDFRQNDPPEITIENIDSFKERIAKGMNYLKTLKGNICVITHSEWMKEALALQYVPDYGESIRFP